MVHKVCDRTARGPQGRADCGAPPFFPNGPLPQIGRAPVVLRAFGPGEMGEAGLRILEYTATEFGQLTLVALPNGVPPLLPFLLGRGSAHSPQQGVHLRSGWGWHLLWRFCLLGNHQPIRKALGHTASRACLNPLAPAVVSVAGGRSPRFPRSRKTSRHLSKLSLWAVENLSKPCRPSSQLAHPQSTPVFCPQPRNGSSTGSITREAPGSCRQSRGRTASSSSPRLSAIALPGLVEKSKCPPAFSEPYSISGWDLPPTDSSPRSFLSASLG